MEGSVIDREWIAVMQRAGADSSRDDIVVEDANVSSGCTLCSCCAVGNWCGHMRAATQNALTVVGEKPFCGDLKVQIGYSRLLRDCNSFSINILVLRDGVHNSNFILLSISIEIKVLEHGKRFTVIDYKTSKPRFDYHALQQSYAKMLSDGPFKAQTELARHLGVRRVWVSIVLKGIKRRAG